MAVLIVAFFAVFVLTLVCAGAGWKYFENKSKRQILKRLEGGGIAPEPESQLLRDTSPSGSGRRLDIVRALEMRIRQAGMNWTPGRLLVLTAVPGGAGLLLGMWLPVLIYPELSAAALACLLGAVPWIVVSCRRNSRLRLMEEQFPEALDFLSRAMRAGHAFSVSLEMMGEEIAEPMGSEFRKVFNEQNLGAPIDIALRNMADRCGLLDVRIFVSAVVLQKQTGGNLSEILVKLAALIRERFRLKGQIRASSAHGKVTGLVLTVMPLLLMLGLSFLSPKYLKTMVEDPDGKILIVGAIVGQFLGYACIRKITEIKV